MKHWAHGGETRLANLVTLCRFHHRLVHEWQVVIQVLDDGVFRFLNPRGKMFDSPALQVTDWAELVATHAERLIAINPQTAVTRWTGEALDLGLAVEVLVQRARRAKNVPAGTSMADSGPREKTAAPGSRAPA